MGNDSTKDLLLRAAKTLFAKKGYDGTTVKEIAEQAGVNVSLVSYHFNGKENLFYALLEEFGNSRVGATERFLKGPTSFEDMRTRLTLMLEENMDYSQNEPELNEIMNRECMGTVRVGTRDIYERVFRKAHDNLVAFFRTAQEIGILAADIVPEDRTMLFIGAMVHTLRIDPMHEDFFGISLRDPVYRDRIIKGLVRMAMEGSTP